MSAAIVGGLIVVLLLAGACLAFLNELDDSLHGIVLLALGA